MLSLTGIGFATPWVLLALVALPAIWWLLRLTPPAARRVRFPAVRLLFGLAAREEEPAHTPPWLLALRLLIAALAIVALARPLLHPAPALSGSGALLAVLDDGWAAAAHWDLRLTALDRLLDQAERSQRPVLLLRTAPPASGEAIRISKLMSAAVARSQVHGLVPQPWRSDRQAAAAVVAAADLPPDTSIVWFSDGVTTGDGGSALAAALARRGELTVWLEPLAARAAALLPPQPTADGLAVTALRAAAPQPAQLWLRAEADGGRVLDRQPLRFAAGADRSELTLHLPAEMTNRLTRLSIEGQASAGAVVLLDERFRRRPVGLASGASTDVAQPLLSELYYLKRALDPYATVREGGIDQLLKRQLSLLVLADIGQVVGDDHAALQNWLESGGVLVRFAGPRLAAHGDDLLPVPLRAGDRSLGGVLTWEKPAHLSAFDRSSPFFGLPVPPEVTVERQVLAEPSLDLAQHTWARLSDGTPLVTATRRGKGWLVLVHTTANAQWSNLPLSGLFVEMMHRLLGLTQGVAGSAPAAGTGDVLLTADQTLDGFGKLGPAGSDTRPLHPAEIRGTTAGPQHPPGYYGRHDERLALNLTTGMTELNALGDLPAGVRVETLGQDRETDLLPPLLGLTLALILFDLLVALWLRGLLRRRADVALGLLLALAPALSLLPPTPAHAAESTSSIAGTLDSEDFAIAASSDFRLAYVRTGDEETDAVSQAGLAGLSQVLNLRTSAKTAEPLAIDIEHDPILFFPLVYWPMAPGQPTLSAAALAKVDDYMKHGGTILFDTRDQDVAAPGGPGPGAAILRRLLDKLDTPPLVPVPNDHVLTKAFYLLHDFPGRYDGGEVWVERQAAGYDGVSGLIIGSNDWAAAWAIDADGRPLLPVVPGGERQREYAYRFGINLVMYCLTGSYKTDQVHVPTILERLGQ